MKAFLSAVAVLFVACDSTATEPQCVPPPKAEYVAEVTSSDEPTCEDANARYARRTRFLFKEGRLQVTGDVESTEQRITPDKCRTGVILTMTDNSVRVFLFSWDKTWNRGTGYVIIDGCRLPMTLSRRGTDI